MRNFIKSLVLVAAVTLLTIPVPVTTQTPDHGIVKPLVNGVGT